MEPGKELSFWSQMNMSASLPLTTCKPNGKRGVQNLSEPRVQHVPNEGCETAVVLKSMGSCEE